MSSGEIAGAMGWAEGGFRDVFRGAGWRGEVVARLQDFVARKQGVAAQTWGQMLRGIEENLSPAQLKAALRQALQSLRPEVADAEVDAEFARLCSLIQAHGEKTSIANYGAYVFSVDVHID